MSVSFQIDRIRTGPACKVRAAFPVKIPAQNDLIGKTAIRGHKNT